MSYKTKNGKLVRNPNRKLAAKLSHLTDAELLASNDPGVLAVLTRRVAMRREHEATLEEMAKAGIVFDTGERRIDRSGHRAIVWKLTPDASERFHEHYGRPPNR
jgi:hypothetical protein